MTSVTACSPIDLINQRRQSGKHRRRAKQSKASKIELLDACLEAAMEKGLPKRSAKRLKTFIGGGSVGCDHYLFENLSIFHIHSMILSGALPYPADISKAIDTVYDSARKLYNLDLNSSGGKDDTKRLSKTCFAEVLRCINLLRRLIQALTSMGVTTAANMKKGTSATTHSTNISMPAYMSLDLGLRQASIHPTFFLSLIMFSWS